MPLLGPIGGGLGFASGALVAAAGGAAPSSAALITNLPLLVLALVLLLEEKNNMLVLPEEAAVLLVATLGVTTKPEAADAMLQLAISCSLSDVFKVGIFLCVCDGLKCLRKIRLRKKKPNKIERL